MSFRKAPIAMMAVSVNLRKGSPYSYVLRIDVFQASILAFLPAFTKSTSYFGS